MVTNDNYNKYLEKGNKKSASQSVDSNDAAEDEGSFQHSSASNI